MAILKHRLKRKTDDGAFDTIHLETSAGLVLLANGTTVQENIDLLTKTKVPTGMIAMWSGLTTDIPDGWQICDGTNGTPDLRNKFVIGAGDQYNTGDSGGEATHTLTTDEMPAHSHADTNELATAVNNDSGTLTLGTGGIFTSTKKFLTQTATEETGGGQAFNLLPPYYALCYIMKL